MKYIPIAALLVCSVLLNSCKKENTIKEDNTLKETEDTPSVTIEKNKSKEEMPWIDEVLKTVPKNPKPIFGYRFIIEGDFDGDGKKEKLAEHFYSEKEKKETCKFYQNIEELDQLMALTIKKETRTFLLSDNTKIKTLNFSHIENFGLSFLKNEGDLNGDGTDEISYVIDYADYSNLNSWHIATYKDNEWKDIYTFDIWDWQLPNLPEAFNDYGFFGVQNKTVNAKNKAANKELETNLKNFKGLVRKIKNNKIEITYRTEEADQGKKIIDLSKPHIINDF